MAAQPPLRADSWQLIDGSPQAASRLRNDAGDVEPIRLRYGEAAEVRIVIARKKRSD